MSLRDDNRKVSLSDFYCEDCGIRLTLPRPRNKQRNNGHIKTMWCPRCRRETQFIEVRECDFGLEYVKQWEDPFIG
ncbi:hypothetical protein SG0102_02160 [Intestinibaculum porci]|uniref:Uncharacterized protein n=1 Tax=Intestinibaculum porci TaxID=2487118 RepID=A0A3G9J3W7_9FIRM|nr:hypothetical protein SG0102_02160 [Intestinibaculum porci]